MLHAISPISMKLWQFKGSTPKLKETNWFLFWFFRGEIDHPAKVSSDLLLYQPVSLRQHFWLVSSLKLDIWEITLEAVASLV